MPIAGGVIGAGGEIAWPKRPGAVLRVESEVLEQCLRMIMGEKVNAILAVTTR